MLSGFHLIPERNGWTDGRTDRRTDRFAISISRVSMLTSDKNVKEKRTKNKLMSVTSAVQFRYHEGSPESNE